MRLNKLCFLGLVLYIFVLFAGSIFAQTLKINEVVSLNYESMKDEDGDGSDWIEIYNPNSNSVNLLNYGLSDNANNLLKWTFPDITLESNEFLLVFASKKNRRINAYWETIIDWGDEWKYFIGFEEPPLNWESISFDDSDWLTGPSGFGDGNDDDATNIPEIGWDVVKSVYIRNTFVINDVNDVLSALLHIDFDDAFVAWLNGVEIAREKIGYYGNHPAYNELEDISFHDAQIYQGGQPNNYIIDDIQSILQTGNNVLAIQANTMDYDMTMIPFFTLGYANEPATIPYVSEFVEPNLLNLHTNFKLGEDESIYLADASGNLIDQMSTTELVIDVSIGRQPDGSSNLYFFSETTPDTTNSTLGLAGFTVDPIIDNEAGFYDGSVQISISGSGDSETIYYSLDGTIPSDTSATSFIYSTPLMIDSTTTVRVRSFKQDCVPSKTITKTFLLNTDHYLPVISLTTDPYNFFDYDYGIYAMGPNAYPSFPFVGANFWQDWERPIHLEMFETDQSLALKTECGIKIFGFASRGHAQKSLALFARGQYGKSSFEHQIFEDKPYSSFQSIVLRNSGGDWLYSNIRDGFMANNLKGTNLAYQGFRPAVVYLNGEYWGIYNIREKLNEHFYASNFGVDPDNINYVENHYRPILGDAIHYVQMLDYIDNHDLNIQEYYDHVCNLMDIENFISYQVAQIWYANIDWPGANNKYWQERVPGAKWRWQIYDLDQGMGLWENSDHNTLEYALADDGPWGSPYRNQPWATYLFRKLVENDEFVEKLVTRFSDYMNTIFEEESLSAKVNSTFDFLYQEMEDHFGRWVNLSTHGSFDLWYDNERVIMNNFILVYPGRNQYMRQFLSEQFNLSGTFELTIDIDPIESGTVQVNSMTLDDHPWTGIYFQDYPTTITAIVPEGYEFTGWSGDSNSNSLSIIVEEQDSNVNLVANFEKTGSNMKPVINEINYNSSDQFDPNDWVEIYNPSNDETDLSGWHFKDSDNTHDFIFPQNYILASKDYLILCRDTLAFKANFPDITNIAGEFDFGLSGSGENIRLFDDTMTTIDSVHYGVSSPWSTEPNGNGPTLSLINAKMNNNLPESWSASNLNGTPGTENDNWEPYPPPFSEKLAIMKNYPNPFASYTTITYSIPEDGKVKLSIYNLKGQLVKKLVNEIQEIGAYTEIWDGKNSQGKLVRSGVYFYQIKQNGKSKTKKMILVR